MNARHLSWGTTLALTLLCTVAFAQAAAPMARSTPCFHSRQIETWKASDAKTLFVSVGLRRYYRLDFGVPCHTLMRPGAFLITKFSGSQWICAATDWDLHVARSRQEVPEACIVKKMTEVSPSEATDHIAHELVDDLS